MIGSGRFAIQRRPTGMWGSEMAMTTSADIKQFWLSRLQVINWGVFDGTTTSGSPAAEH